MICDICCDEVESGHIDHYYSNDDQPKYRCLCHACWKATRETRRKRDLKWLASRGIYITATVTTDEYEKWLKERKDAKKKLASVEPKNSEIKWELLGKWQKRKVDWRRALEEENKKSKTV